MIEQVYGVGDDALQNLFEIYAEIPGVNATDFQSFKLRTTTISIPATGANTYEIHYKTQVMTKVGGKVMAPNEFTFSFRVDRYWKEYQALIKWKNLIANSYGGEIGPDTYALGKRGTVTVIPVQSDGNQNGAIKAKWSFEGVFPKEVGEVSFDYSGGEPIILNVTMGFMRMNDTVA